MKLRPHKVVCRGSVPTKSYSGKVHYSGICGRLISEEAAWSCMSTSLSSHQNTKHANVFVFSPYLDSDNSGVVSADIIIGALGTRLILGTQSTAQLQAIKCSMN